MSCPLFHCWKKLKLAECPADKDELARAEFFWSRRPRLLPAAGYDGRSAMQSLLKMTFIERVAPTK